MSPTETTLRTVVEPLAGLVRRAGSRDEEQAARLVVDAFARVGTAARIDEVAFRDGYASLLMPLAAVGLVVGLRSAGGRRRPLGALAAAAATAALVDDVENGRRVWRSAVRDPQPTWNVVAQAGDGEADRTLVVLAHHDAAPTGRVFDPGMQRWVARALPRPRSSAPTRLPAVVDRRRRPRPRGAGCGDGPKVLARAGRRSRR